MNLNRLREILAGVVHHLSQTHRHVDLEDVADRLGIGPPGEGSKAERMRAALDGATDDDLPQVARRLLAAFPPGPRLGTRSRNSCGQRTEAW